LKSSNSIRLDYIPGFAYIIDKKKERKKKRIKKICVSVNIGQQEFDPFFFIPLFSDYRTRENREFTGSLNVAMALTWEYRRRFLLILVFSLCCIHFNKSRINFCIGVSHDPSCFMWKRLSRWMLYLFRRKMVSVIKWFQGSHFSGNHFPSKAFSGVWRVRKIVNIFLYFYSIILTYKNQFLFTT